MPSDKIAVVGANIAEKATMIWNVADMLRGPFKPHEYGLVILPMTVVKRFHDCLLPTWQAVQDTYEKVKTLAVIDGFLTRASGYQFYNISKFTFEKLLADPENIEANFRDYLAGFSANVQDVLAKFDFDNVIKRMVESNTLYLTIKEFNQRFVSLRPELEAVAKAMAGNGDDAEDAVQETLLRLWVKRDSLDGHPNHRALAMASLRNIIRDKWRKDQHEATAHGERLENVGMESPPMFNDEMEIIRYIVDHLPPLQATVFRMKEIEGYDSKDIIAITGCSEANLRQLLSRARRKIREEFVRLNGQ